MCELLRKLPWVALKSIPQGVATWSEQEKKTGPALLWPPRRSRPSLGWCLNVTMHPRSLVLDAGALLLGRTYLIYLGGTMGGFGPKRGRKRVTEKKKSTGEKCYVNTKRRVVCSVACCSPPGPLSSWCRATCATWGRNTYQRHVSTASKNVETRTGNVCWQG